MSASQNSEWSTFTPLSEIHGSRARALGWGAGRSPARKILADYSRFDDDLRAPKTHKSHTAQDSGTVHVYVHLQYHMYCGATAVHMLHATVLNDRSALISFANDSL